MIRRVLLLVVPLAALSGAAHAQARRLTLDIETQTIIGEVRKPEVTVLITKQNLNTPYDLVLKESFIPKIVSAAEEKPF